MRALSSTTRVIILPTPYSTGTLYSFIPSCIRQRVNSHCVQAMLLGLSSAVMEIQTKCYVTSGEEAVSCARRKKRKLNGGDETEKVGRISEGENDVPGKGASISMKDTAKHGGMKVKVVCREW